MNSNVTLVNEIESMVEDSAQLLDHKRPGWFNEIDLEDFDIQNPLKCVLAQLASGKNSLKDYLSGMKELGLRQFSDGFSTTYLFWAHDKDDEGLTNRAWRRAIEHRRAA